MTSSTALTVVSYDIWVNGTRFTQGFVQNMTVSQEFGEQELATVRIEYPRSWAGLNSMPLWPDSAPVQIRYGRIPGGYQTFYGYVNHVGISSESKSSDHTTEVEYTLLGTSKFMLSDVTKTWGQTTPTAVAKSIAAKWSLRCVLTKAPFVSDYEVQSAESDFRFLNRMATKWGFRLWVSGGTLYFIDPAALIQGTGSQGVPTYTLNKGFGTVDTIADFKVLSGGNLPGSQVALRQLNGIDQNSGQPFTVTATNGPANPLIVKTMTDYVTTSMAEGQALVNAWQAASQFYTQASANLTGTSYLYPGKIVNLTGRQLPGNSSGQWLVCSARHLLSKSGTQYPVNDRYVTQVKLLRNTATLPSVSSVSVLNPEFVGCQINGGQWISNNQNVYYDGVISV